MHTPELFESDFDRQHRELIEIFDKSKKTQEKIKIFGQIIKHYYAFNKRNFSWRENLSAYRVLVSEIMLQQTQTERVAQKFEVFIEQFPDINTLAKAPFGEVLRLWKGLGYNRRALALQKIAVRLSEEYKNILPSDPHILQTFPGIGKATASSIIAFAYNIPTMFIETNVRTVFIHFFFKNSLSVHDKEIEPLVQQALDIHNPREWYYALMDYGVWLKKNVGNLSRKSAHYAKQSKFEGSNRQIRGQILKVLLDKHVIKKDILCALVNPDIERVEKILSDLCAEGYIKIINDEARLK